MTRAAGRGPSGADPSNVFGAAVRQVFMEVANGDQVIILRPDREVTPAGAADLLGASRQFVDRLLTDGGLALRRLPGRSHRRIKVGDVAIGLHRRAPSLPVRKLNAVPQS